MKCPIEVVTADADNGKVESTKIIDHANSSDRKWLGSHCFWAMRNNRQITTTPLNESR